MSRVRASCLALGVAVGLAAPRAWADADVKEADRLFRVGAAAYKAGDYRGAADLLDRSLRISPHGVAYYAAGLALQAAGDSAPAADYYERALSSGQLGSDQRAEAQERLSQLDRGLGRLSIEAPSGSRLRLVQAPSGMRIGTRYDDVASPLRIRAVPGQYTVGVELPDGTTQSRQLAVVAGATAAFTFVEPKEREPPRPAPLKDESSTGRPIQSTLGFVALGGAAVSVGAAGWFWSRAKSAQSDFYESDFTDSEARDRAESMKTWTNVAWGTAALLAGTGAVLLLTAPPVNSASPAPTGRRMRAWIGVNCGGAAFGGQF